MLCGTRLPFANLSYWISLPFVHFGLNLTHMHRRKIRALIASGEMEVGDFQKALNTSSKGFASFMALHGPYHGSESSVYYSAWAFFKKRELRGVKTAKRIKIASSAGPHESQVDISDVGLKEEATDDTEAHGTNSYLWWLFCAWGALALATDAVWDFTFD